jgi:hypothetical protein
MYYTTNTQSRLCAQLCSKSGYGTDDASSDEEQQDPPQPIEPEIVYDVNDPPMVVGSIYPNMSVFKLAIA